MAMGIPTQPGQAAVFLEGFAEALYLLLLVAEPSPSKLRMGPATVNPLPSLKNPHMHAITIEK